MEGTEDRAGHLPKPGPGIQEMLDGLHLDQLDLTTEDFDFDQLDEDLERFQKDEFVRSALEKGVELREYSTQMEDELRRVEAASVDDYLNASDDIAKLHNYIVDCDGTLESLESMLRGFQSNLGQISSEIKSLQDESQSKNVLLRNRKELEKRLYSSISQLVIPEDMVQQICEADVNEAYLEYLIALGKKVNFAAVQKDEQTIAVADVEHQLQKLCVKAVSKVRDFLLRHIVQLKKPKTNIQIIQQNVLLKYKNFMEFLQHHGPETGSEVHHVYVDTVAKLFVSNFKTYVSYLPKLLRPTSTKLDVVGTRKDTSLPSNKFTSFFSSAKSPPPSKGSSKAGEFSLSGREKILTDTSPAIIPHVAMEREELYSPEQLFRSLNLLLMDASTSEYLFCLDFFGDRNMFDDISSKTQQVVIDYLTSLVSTYNDAVGLLIMIRLMHQFQVVMLRRRVPCLDTYFDRLNMILWPRFKQVMDAHVESLKALRASDMKVVDVHPHYVTRRYAELSSAVYQLNTEKFQEMLGTSLRIMREEAEQLWMSLSAQFPDMRKQLVFLINQYDLFLSVYRERGISGEDVQRVENLLSSQIAAFVEEELSQTFGTMIQFVKRTEPALDGTTANDGSASRVNGAEVEKIAKEFAMKWKLQLKVINEHIMEYFPNFLNGQDILKQVLSQMLLYYTRFTKIVDHCFTNPPFRRDLVANQVILYEIKTYSKDY